MTDETNVAPARGGAAEKVRAFAAAQAQKAAAAAAEQVFGRATQELADMAEQMRREQTEATERFQRGIDEAERRSAEAAEKRLKDAEDRIAAMMSEAQEKISALSDEFAAFDDLDGAEVAGVPALQALPAPQPPAPAVDHRQEIAALTSHVEELAKRVLAVELSAQRPATNDDASPRNVSPDPGYTLTGSSDPEKRPVLAGQIDMLKAHVVELSADVVGQGVRIQLLEVDAYGEDSDEQEMAIARGETAAAEEQRTKAEALGVRIDDGDPDEAA